MAKGVSYTQENKVTKFKHKTDKLSRTIFAKNLF